ncbi:MAG: zinc ribbon domain-containing protein [Chloroflexia bacterium]|nr:zinc ribbon domain-containing protein [Chloroflexia bacterium]
MPIYEYRCPSCRGRFSKLVLRVGQPDEVRCPRCGSTEVERLISRFSTVRSEEEHLESLADPAALADVDENDPQSVARWARRMKRSLGDEMGDEMDELIAEIESGAWQEEMEGGPGAGMGDEDLGWA